MNIDLPIFMPDATRAFIKTCSQAELEEAGISALVVNTFHLFLQPGIDIIKKAGGIHEFMNWSGPLLSDSGGFQIFSLIHQNKSLGVIKEEGAIFKSPLDGSRQEISPEKSIQIQFDLGTNFIVCLDDCPPHELSWSDINASVERTIRWARRSRQEYIRQVKKRKLDESSRPQLVAVVQGGLSTDLRKKCLEALMNLEEEKFLGQKVSFAVYGFGGRPVDEKGNFLEEIMSFTAKIIPDDRIKLALGVGSPADIYQSYQMGWKAFDCVIPSREGRHGRVYQFKDEEGDIKSSDFYYSLNVKQAKYRDNFEKINPQSKFKDLREHSWAYLHHLFKLKESLAFRWASLNNLEFYAKLMKKIK